jgi:hypothetical protein
MTQESDTVKLTPICELKYSCKIPEDGRFSAYSKYIQEIKMIYRQRVSPAEIWFDHDYMMIICRNGLRSILIKELPEHIVAFLFESASDRIIFQYDHRLYEAEFKAATNELLKEGALDLINMLPPARYRKLPIILISDLGPSINSLNMMYYLINTASKLQVGKFFHVNILDKTQSNFEKMIDEAHLIDRTIKQVLIECASQISNTSALWRCKTSKLYEPRLIPLIFGYLNNPITLTDLVPVDD